MILVECEQIRCNIWVENKYEEDIIYFKLFIFT